MLAVGLFENNVFAKHQNYRSRKASCQVEIEICPWFTALAPDAPHQLSHYLCNCAILKNPETNPNSRLAA